MAAITKPGKASSPGHDAPPQGRQGRLGLRPLRLQPRTRPENRFGGAQPARRQRSCPSFSGVGFGFAIDSRNDASSPAASWNSTPSIGQQTRNANRIAFTCRCHGRATKREPRGYGGGGPRRPRRPRHEQRQGPLSSRTTTRTTRGHLHIVASKINPDTGRAYNLERRPPQALRNGRSSTSGSMAACSSKAARTSNELRDAIARRAAGSVPRGPDQATLDLYSRAARARTAKRDLPQAGRRSRREAQPRTDPGAIRAADPRPCRGGSSCRRARRADDPLHHAQGARSRRLCVAGGRRPGRQQDPRARRRAAVYHTQRRAARRGQPRAGPSLPSRDRRGGVGDHRRPRRRRQKPHHQRRARSLRGRRLPRHRRGLDAQGRAEHGPGRLRPHRHRQTRTLHAGERPPALGREARRHRRRGVDARHRRTWRCSPPTRRKPAPN